MGHWLAVPTYIQYFFEFFAFGNAMITGSGLGDPCHRNFPDVFAYMSLQEREDITTSAQVN